MVGQLAVIHHLQEDVEEIRMCFLDFVEQQHAVRVLVDAISQQAALIEADVARRRADEPRNRMPLHVFRHIEAQQLHTEHARELLRHLGFADARGAREEIAADRLFGVAKARAGELDRARKLGDRRILPVDDTLQRRLDVAEHLGVVLRDGLRRDTRHRGDRRLDLFEADGLLAPPLGQQHLRRAGFVDDVDRLVRQFAVVDVAGGKLHRALNGVVGVFQPVELLEIGLETLEDLDRIGDRRLIDVDLLEPPHQRAVLLEILAVFLVGRRADAAQRARRERRFEKVRGIHRAAGGRACANDGVNLINEQDRLAMLLNLFHHLLEAFLEIAAIACAGEQRAHVERIDRGIRKDIRHIAVDDLLGESLGDGGLADARITHQQRIVLLPAAEHLDGAVDLRFAPDQRIDLAGQGLLVEVGRVERERAFLFRLVVLSLSALLGRLESLFALLLGAARAARLGSAGALGDAVGDVVHRVVARHLLLLQEIGGVALALGEDRNEHVRAGDFLTPRRLDVNHSPLDDPLESGRGLGIRAIADDERLEFGVDIGDDCLAQRVEIDVAGLHHGRRVLIVDQRQKEMLERREFMPPRGGMAERLMQCVFE